MTSSRRPAVPKALQEEVARLRTRVAELERAESERVRVSEAFSESEARFRTLVANVPGTVYRSAIEHPFKDVFLSEGVEALTGYTAAEFMSAGGTTFGELTLAEDRGYVEHAVQSAVAGSGTFAVRYRLRHRDGAIRWVHDQGRVARAPDGHPVWLDGVVVEITDRANSEEALRQSEARYRTIVASVPGAVYLCQPELPWKNLFMSDGVQALTGYPAAAFAPVNGDLFTSITLPEDLEGITRATTEAIAQGRPWTLRYRIRHADGGIRWVYEGGQAAYDSSGKPLFLGGVILDITERMHTDVALRASEMRLVEAQRIAHIGSWEMNLVTLESTWSEEMYRIFHQDPARMTPDRETLASLIHPADRHAVSDSFAAALSSRSGWNVACRLLLPGEIVVHVAIRAEFSFGANGEAVKVAGTVQDVTELHRAEEVKAALEAQLRQAQKMEAIGTLAGGIAHDFNNILAAVIGHAEMLSQDLPYEHPGQDGVSGILVACQRARDLVQQILTFSRLRERERRLIPLEPVVMEALKLLRPSLPATIEIRSLIRGEEMQVLADPSQVHQVLLNLCTNAAHAMQDRGGVLEVDYEPVIVDHQLARRHPTLRVGARYASLTISDTGHGMPPQVLDRIFDPFFTTKQPGEGTGLGLAVVHGIMQSHDGLVTVTSEPGKGTSFRLYFPTADGQASPVSGEESPAPRGQGEHVLVVDDEAVLARIAGRILERLGYRVTTHTRPADALADFLQRPDAFDLVFSDLTMPGMTGIELAARLLAHRPDLPILLTSGYTGALDTDEYERVGIRELVGKPFMATTIAAAVERALRGTRPA